jgi:ATP-dependent RNA helicase DHX29
MAHHAIPEMLRLSLQDLALRIKVLKVKLGSSIEDVLSRALDPPSSINIQRAVASLVEVKALTANEDITAMGRILSKLPMDVHLGKFIIMAALFRCLDPALTIAATLNSKSPFITPFGFEAQASSAKKGFSTGAYLQESADSRQLRLFDPRQCLCELEKSFREPQLCSHILQKELSLAPGELAACLGLMVESAAD